MSQINPMQDAGGGDEEVVHHVSARKRRDVEPGSMQLNLTAMIDIIFLLLIYFVVTANFTPEEGVLTTRVPAAEGQGQPQEMEIEKDEIRITLTSRGSEVRVSIDRLGNFGDDFDALFARLSELRISESNPNGIYEPDNPIVVAPGREVRWQHAANAFNAAVRARYTNVSWASVE